MMKKMLVLMMVLGLCGVVSAGVITIGVANDDAKAVYGMGETITIEFVASGFADGPGSGDLGQLLMGITISDAAGGSAAVGTLNSYFDQQAVNGSLGTGTELIKGIMGAAQGFDGTNAVPNGAVAYQFEFTTGTTAGTYTIGISDLDTRGLFGTPFESTAVSANLTVIPEPMTVALLGLGCLFIRRRK